MIKVNNICKSYHKNSKKFKALEDITFDIKKGEVVGLLGMNGAGKTTLIKTLCNLIEPDKGEIYINNLTINHKDKRAVKFISTVMEGNRNIYWKLSIIENVDYFLGIRGLKKNKDKLNSLLYRFDLYNKRKEQVKNLSRGMQQKVAIIIALMLDTEVLILDEPTLGLDVGSNEEIRKLLLNIVKDEHKTILISSHDMNLIEKLCTRVIIINKGKIITDNSVENLVSMFNVKAYSIVLSDILLKEQEVELRNFFDIEVLEKDKHSIVKFTISEIEDFFNIIDFMRKLKLRIDQIQKDEINFEKVFLNIIKKEDK